MGRIGGFPGWTALCVAVSVASATPSLAAGFVGDDWFHQSLIQNSSSGVVLRDLFVFIDQERSTLAFSNVTEMFWWADPNLSIGFMRPLAAFTHLVDHWLFPGQAWAHHLHSLLWMALSLISLALVFRRLLGPSSAALALLLFAIDDASSFPEAWLANRNALVAFTFGVLSIFAFVGGAPEDGSRASAPQSSTNQTARTIASLGLFTLSLLAGESGVCVLGYLTAWAFTRAPAGRLRSFAQLMPFVAVTALWAFIRAHLGYGAAGSGLYLDPTGDPAGYLAGALERMPTLFMGLIFQVPLVTWPELGRGSQLAIAGVGGVALLLFALEGFRKTTFFWVSAKRRFWSAGMLLSLLPLCAGFPMDRLLLFPSIGALALLSEFVVDHWQQVRSHRLVGIAVICILVLHGPLSATSRVLRMTLLPQLNETFELGTRPIPSASVLHQQTLIFVNGSLFGTAYTRLLREQRGASTPKHVVQLGPSSTAVEVHRIDERTLVLTPAEPYGARPIDRMVHGDLTSLQLGQGVHTELFTAEVLQRAPNGWPSKVSIQFDVSLEHPSVHLVYVDSGGAIVPLDLPVGAKREIPRPGILP